MEVDQCEGCVVLTETTKCSIKEKGYQNKCPCPTCIVKIMCRHDCEKMNILVQQVYQEA